MINAIKTFGALIIVTLLGFLGYQYHEYNENKEIEEKNNELKKQVSENLQTDNGINYKDGTYTANGEYMSPGGKDGLEIKVELKNNTIVAIQFFNQANHNVSKKWQDTFAKGLDAVVIGKKISEVNLDNVNGSSLTPIGFNIALNKIKSQAKI